MSSNNNNIEDENYTEEEIVGELEIQQDVIDQEQEQEGKEGTVPKAGKGNKSKQQQQVIKNEEEQSPTISLELEKLEGIGKETANKLRSYGIYDIAALALSQAGELVDTLSNGGNIKNVSLDSCSKLIVKANNYLEETGILDKPLTPSKVLLEKSLVLKRFSTGDKELDEKFFGGGGVESRAITEFFGRYGTGKTQLCYSIIANAANNGTKILFIDTENTYSPTRVEEISKLKGYDPKKVQNNILVYKPASVSVFVKFMHKLEHLVHDNKIEIIIIDSIIALHKAEYIGRGLLAPKQQNLTQIMSKLDRISTFYDCAIVITNHVIANPTGQMGQDELPAGGNSIGHSSTHRIYFQKRGIKKPYTVMTMIDSPRYSMMQRCIDLEPEGVVYKDPKEA